jgi:hypothetical protein
MSKLSQFKTIPGAGGLVQPAGSVVLTSSSAPAQACSFTAMGQGVTLPDATGVSVGADVFALANNSPFFGFVKDSTGAIRGFLPPYATVRVSLADNTTAAGAWTLAGGCLLAPTAELAGQGATLNASAKIVAIPLDTNRTMVLFGATSVYAVVYDSGTNTFGAVTLVRTVASGAWGAVPTTTAGNALFVGLESNSIYGRVLSTSGTTVTVNAEASAAAGTSPTGLSNILQVGAGATWAVGYTGGSAAGGFHAITVAGTTVTLGAAFAHPTHALAVGSAAPHLYATSASTFAAVGASTGSSTYCLQMSVAGVVLTAAGGALAGSLSGAEFRTVKWGSRFAVLARDSGTSLIFAVLYTVTGSTVTQTSVVDILGSTSSATTDTDAIVCNGKLVVAAVESSTNLRFNVLTDTAGTVSKGTSVTLGSLGSGALAAAVGTSGTDAIFALAPSAGYGAQIARVSAAGASPTVTLSDGGLATQSGQVDTVSLSDPNGSNASARRLIALGGALTIPLPLRSTANPRAAIQAVHAQYGVAVQLPITANAGLVGTPAIRTGEAWALSAIPSGTQYTLQRIQCAA